MERELFSGVRSFGVEIKRGIFIFFDKIEVNIDKVMIKGCILVWMD